MQENFIVWEDFVGGLLTGLTDMGREAYIQKIAVNVSPKANMPGGPQFHLYPHRPLGVTFMGRFSYALSLSNFDHEIKINIY